MLVSYVLRLVESEAAHGRLVGEVEDVRSGAVRRIRDVGDLVAAVREMQLTGITTDLPENETWHPLPASPRE